MKWHYKNYAKVFSGSNTDRTPRSLNMLCEVEVREFNYNKPKQYEYFVRKCAFAARRVVVKYILKIIDFNLWVH